MAKKWIVCMQCRYNSKCRTGQAKIQYIEEEFLISSDTGCYNYDQYFTLYNNLQLNLFKPMVYS